MRYCLFLIILFFVFPLKNSFAQRIPAERPKLIVGIVVDQLRYDYLYRFMDKYEPNGLRRLMNEGLVCKNAHYDYMFSGANSGYATISTGANPSVHGIVSDEWYVGLSDKTEHCSRDEKYNCVGNNESNEKHSASKLMSSTFGDELKLAWYKQPIVLSVSIDPSASVMLSGHLVDGAYWFDVQTGTFVTSSAYKTTLPAWVTDFNKKKFADSYLDKTWTTLLPDSTYVESLADNNSYERGIRGQITFPYDLKALSTIAGGKRDYNILRQTPMADNIVKDFAISAIVNEKMGKDDIPDYLCINFCATGAIGKQFGIASREMEDACLRLDKEIKHLLDFLDSYVGKGNVLVYFTAAHGATYPPKLMTDMGMPAGEFNLSLANTLLKSFLNATYGNGNWIKKFSDHQIYLNESLIQDAKIDIAKFESDVAGFLIQFAGVANVATASMLQYSNYVDGVLAKMQNSYYQKRSGNIVYQLQPGWAETTSNNSSSCTGYSYETHVPLIFYGWRISRKVVYDKISIADIAPTLSLFLNIALPSGSEGKPAESILKLQ
ncbi:MAG TPA: alkaline phosphatase family protein [Bacteroidales bacterium]|nr:alkaline phosphatase family protein [Bacteroidales bacterium]